MFRAVPASEDIVLVLQRYVSPTVGTEASAKLRSRAESVDAIGSPPTAGLCAWVLADAMCV